MMRFFAVATLLSLSVTVPLSQANGSAPASDPALPALDYRAPRASAAVSPLDRLEVTVFREPELSAPDVPVDESGRATLPLIGGISAAGKSTEALATEIASRLLQYVRNPQVSVFVKQAAIKRIAVTGSVMTPGVFPLEGRTTLLQAVALARGPSQVAALDQALIFREHGGRRTAAKFNLDAIARGKVEDPEVLPGDTIAIASSRMKTAWRDIVMSLRSFNIFSVIP